jgi:hypothetical protein
MKIIQPFSDYEITRHTNLFCLVISKTAELTEKYVSQKERASVSVQILFELSLFFFKKNMWRVTLYRYTVLNVNCPLYQTPDSNLLVLNVYISVTPLTILH